MDKKETHSDSEKKKKSPTNEKKDKEIEKTDFMNTSELNRLIEEDWTHQKKSHKKIEHILIYPLMLIILIAALTAFGLNIYNKESTIPEILTTLFLTIFTLFFIVISITYNQRKKKIIVISSIFLLGFLLLSINSSSLFKASNYTTPNFSGKSITEVMKWASQNKITINQEYEYSDMVEEYSIISQSIKAGSTLKDIEELTVSISEGPNPSKEIIVPNMITWEAEKVLQFIQKNYLTNVEIEFVESDKMKDTVIEQSSSGSLKRDDSLKLTFSYGEEETEKEITLIDFTNKSQFEVEFYMKQHQLKYSLETEFDEEIKKGYAIHQSIAAGDKISDKDTEIVITISKGPEIKVPNLSKYTMEEATNWAIQNKLKISFSNQYDDTIPENHIISANYNENDIIEQGTIVKLVISRGNLKMPKVQSLNDFYEWANKYNIAYEEKHEFSDTTPAGEVISYSYKEGQVLNNNDTIIVTISDGVKKTVPNVIGLSKKEAISKIEANGLRYNVTYRNSEEAEGKVINQSLRSGSEVSSGTTVTITVSNGKPVVQDTPKIEIPKEPEKKCENVTVYIEQSHIKSDPKETCSTIKSAYPNLNFVCKYETGQTNGLLKNASEIDEHTVSTCDTITLIIVDNN